MQLKENRNCCRSDIKIPTLIRILILLEMPKFINVRYMSSIKREVKFLYYENSYITLATFLVVISIHYI